ncbi:MAG TPA: Gfo/Idh/MocA family oxidoreductase, partial [Spirochaetia bacterium]|nr:Gfo/Idh/MocA family oxidoreductase [Spirochaetia bacterium]
RQTSGGLIVEETSHWFDLLRFLSQREIRDLHCVTTDRILSDFDFEDVAFASGHFDDGAIFQIEHSLAGFDFSFTVSVYGSKATIRCGMKEETKSTLDAGQSSYVGIVVCGDPNKPATEAQTELFGTESREPETIQQNVVAFVDKLEGASHELCSVEDGIRALELSLLANLCAVENRVLTTREIERIG